MSEIEVLEKIAETLSDIGFCVVIIAVITIVRFILSIILAYGDKK